MRNKTMITVIFLLVGTVFADLTVAQSKHQAGSNYNRVTNEGTERATRHQDRKPENWSIHSSVFLGLREGGRSVSLDSKGNLEKRSKNQESKITVHAADLQELTELIRELGLPRAKTRTVKGKKIYDFPDSSFTITLNGRSFLMDGSSFYDARFVVMTKNRQQAFSRLKEKLTAVGAERLIRSN
jgi:hypothetical protein